MQPRFRLFFLGLALAALLVACGSSIASVPVAAAKTAVTQPASTPTATRTATRSMATATSTVTPKTIKASGTIPRVANLTLTPIGGGKYTLAVTAEPPACDPANDHCQLRFLLNLGQGKYVSGKASRLTSQTITLAVLPRIPAPGEYVEFEMQNGFFTDDGQFYQDVTATEAEVTYYMRVLQ